MKFGKNNAVTQSQTLLIMGIVGLLLFAFIAVPFYKSCKQKALISKLKVINSSLLQANSTYSLATSEVQNEYITNIPVDEFAKTYFERYLSKASTCDVSQAQCWNAPQYVDLRKNKYLNKITYSIVLKNGAVIGFAKDENNLISMIVDIDGKSGDNMLGKDVFVFSFYNSQTSPKICDESVYSEKFIKNGLHYGGYDKCGIPFDTYKSEELLDSNLEDGCNKKSPKSLTGTGVGSACLSLIYVENWSIDKKYPW